MLLFVTVAAQLATVEVRRLPSTAAHQGAVADRDSVYAVDNSTVVRHAKADGRELGRWQGDPARFKHLNSCIVHHMALVCAASNYPDTPMRSQVLWIDRATMQLRRVRDLGAGAGSLTWIDWRDGAWWAGFAHYDKKGGMPGRDHRATALVRYSPGFTEQRRWRFPGKVLARFAPRSTSGGAWGGDGLLYVTGHDLPELYVLQVPARGDTLDHVATLATPTGGQAIGWDAAEPRLLWSIDRDRSDLVASRVPAVTPPRTSPAAAP